jgi:hypothetical protein
MGSTHFQMKTLKHVGTEMALHVLAYNMKRVMRIAAARIPFRAWCRGKFRVSYLRLWHKADMVDLVGYVRS